MAKKYHFYDGFCILACVCVVYNFFPPTPFPPRKEDTNKKPTTQYSLQVPAKKDPKEKETQSKKMRNYVWVVVWNILSFHPYSGKWSQFGWYFSDGLKPPPSFTKKHDMSEGLQRSNSTGSLKRNSLPTRRGCDGR